VAKSTAYTINTMSALPGNFYIGYRPRTSKFVIDIVKDTVEVNDIEFDLTGMKAGFVRGNNIIEDTKLEKEDGLRISKQGNRIDILSIGDTIQYGLADCGAVLGDMPDKIMVHPENHDDTKVRSKNHLIAKNIQTRIEGASISRGPTEVLELEELLKKAGDALIIRVGMGTYDDKEFNPLIMKVQTNHESRIACDIMNSVKELQITNGEAITYEGEAGILIEIGNTNNDVIKPTQAGEAIARGIRRSYHE